jgi:hypothetical protein
VPRNRFFHIVASVMSVWLAICLAEPMQLHTCVMHGGLAIDVDGHTAAGDATHLSASAEHHAGHSHGQSGHDTHSRQCSCLGDCSVGKTPIVLPTAPRQLEASTVHTTTVEFTYSSPSLDAPQFLLPFSNGPPTASSRA